MSNPSIPARHNTKAVRRFENVMCLVQQNWPRAIMVDPAPLASDTFACRFRDAVRGITHYNIAADMLPVVEEWSATYAVAAVKNSHLLLIGPKDVLREMNKLGTSVAGSIIDAAVPLPDGIETPSAKVLAAIITLLEANILPHATIRGITEEMALAAVANATRPIEVMENNGVITLL